MSDEAKVLHEFSDGEHEFRVDDDGRATWFPLKRPEDELGLSDDYDANFAYAAGKEIARLVSSRRWIPVSERLPDKGDVVLAFCRDGGYTFQSACYWHGGWRAAESGAPCDAVKITHWQPLPEPPKP